MTSHNTKTMFQVELLNLSSLTWVEMILLLQVRAQTDAAFCLLEAGCR